MLYKNNRHSVRLVNEIIMSKKKKKEEMLIDTLA